MKPIKANYLAAAAKALAWSNTARGAGRSADADLLDLMSDACRDCAEYAPESGGETVDRKSEVGGRKSDDAQETAVCALCDGIGTRGSSGYTCQNRRCPRFGVPLPKATFEGVQETPQDRSGSISNSGIHSDGRPAPTQHALSPRRGEAF